MGSSRARTSERHPAHSPLPPPRRGERARARGAARIAHVRVRRARLSDSPAIARVMCASIGELSRGAYTARQLAAWSSLPALYHAWAMTAGGERYFLAERGGRIQGYAALRGGEVTAAFVRPGASRHGIGTALLARVEREARHSGVPRLVVRAALSAIAFYEAVGYRGNRAIRVPLPGGRMLAARLLSKRL